MTKLMLRMIALAALPAAALLAQDVTGTWQGTLTVPSGRELRTALKISKGDAGALKAVLYSIDQGGGGMTATSVTLQGSALKIAITGIGGTYEGKLSADGDSINGTWNSGTLTFATEPEACYGRDRLDNSRTPSPAEADGRRCESGV